MIKELTTTKSLRIMYKMFILFWISTTFFQLIDLFTDHYSQWFVCPSILGMWLVLCGFSHLTTRALKKERAVLAAQHKTLMDQIKEQYEKDRAELNKTL